MPILPFIEDMKCMADNIYFDAELAIELRLRQLYNPVVNLQSLLYIEMNNAD